MALAQLPVDPVHNGGIASVDLAGLTHGFVDACGEVNLRFVIGHDLTEPIRNACLAVLARRWRPAITADGSDERDGAQVAQITDLHAASQEAGTERRHAERQFQMLRLLS